MVACVVQMASGFAIPGNDHPLSASGYVTDSGSYSYDTDDPEEADYLCACLNSPVVDARLDQLRRRNQKGHPHVHKKVFDVAPIPHFNASDALHRDLAEIGRVCERKVRDLLTTPSISPR